MNKWTVMIYLGGDNNLSDECVWALKEIRRVGLREGVNVLAQFDARARGAPTRRYDIRENLEGEGAKTRSGLIRGDSDGLLHARAIPLKTGEGGRRYKEENRAYAADLADFIAWAAEKRPADHYMLIISGHGSGAEGDTLLRDENPPRFLSVRRLRWALEKAREKTGRTLDILGLDACAMSTAEIAYELRDEARLMVAAEGFEPNTGWPYHRLMEILNASENIRPKKMAREIVRSYIRYYSDFAVAGISVDMAACNLVKAAEVEQAVAGLASLLAAQLSSCVEKAERGALSDRAVENGVLLAHWRAQSYRFEEYVDLWDFCDLLGCSLSGTEVQQATERVKKAVEECVLRSGYSGSAFQHSRGLSIYFPWTGEVTPRYRGLRFSTDRRVADEELFSHGEIYEHKSEKEKNWLQFLDLYLSVTRREHRNDRNLPLDQLQRIYVDDDSEMEIRFSLPRDRGTVARIAKMKNPPLGFYIDDFSK